MIRFSDTKGENSPMAKMKAPQILEIRRRRRAGESAASLAAEFQLSIDYVRKIGRGKAWRSLA